MVACFVRDEEVVGSNPATPTHEKGSDRLVGALFIPSAKDYLVLAVAPEVGLTTNVGSVVVLPAARAAAAGVAEHPVLVVLPSLTYNC